MRTQGLFDFVFARERQRIKRVARADDQVLPAVQYPGRRPVAYGVRQSLAPDRIACGGIEGDQVARITSEQQITCRRQYAAAYAAAETASRMYVFPFHRACANVHREQRRARIEVTAPAAAVAL